MKILVIDDGRVDDKDHWTEVNRYSYYIVNQGPLWS
jgi:hypothetical protein